MINLEKILKKTSFKIVSPFFKKKLNHFKKENWKSFKRVLVFRLDNKLGNAILLLPLIQSIKSSNPELKIDVMYSLNYSEIFENHPDIHATISYDQKYLLKNPLRYLSLIKQLRKNKYDVVFSSTNSNSFSVSQALFAGFLKSNFTIGFNWKESAEIYSAVVKGNTEIHYSQAQVDLWRYFDENAKFENPRIYFTPEKSQESGKEKVLFWFGATSNKILPKELFEDILLFLNENDIKYKLAAGPHDEHLLKTYTSIKKEDVMFLKGSLKETAKFLKQYKIIIMPDTGPMHLAVALGIPTVQAFINSDPVWYAYKGENLFLINKKIESDDFLAFVKNYLE
jgi:lipopolysaccharide heptosyltransferase III